MKSLLVTLLAGLLFRTLMPDVTIDVADEEYDFVVVGGGNTGCVVASRLSEDDNTKVLLIEAGKSDALVPDVHIPWRAISLQGTDVEWNYNYTIASKDREQYPDRVMKFPRGKVLGGCSSMNYMEYVRGSRHDYDSWEDHGAKGWNFNSIEKYFRKAENAKATNMSERFGRNGPLRLTRNHQTSSPFYNLITTAADEIGIERGDSADIPEGLSHTARTVYQGARVTKILIESRTLRAYGVKYTKGAREFIVRARKEVILSAGAFNSPQLLMLSGIGPRDELEQFNIPVVKDLPGIGSNFQSHFLVNNFYTLEKTLLNATGVDPELQYMEKNIETHTDISIMYLSARTSYFNTPTSLSSSKRPFPDILMFFNEVIDDALLKYSRNLKLRTSVVISHPKSRGTVTLRSSDPWDPPIIDPNIFSVEDDIKIQIAGFRLLEEFEKTSAFRAAGATYDIPSVCAEFFSPEVPRSEEFYRCLIDRTGISIYHACCTAKIGHKHDSYAVVNPELKVYGIEGLRVVDASVMPHVPTANTQAPCYMIGEKAAAMIKKRWRLD